MGRERGLSAHLGRHCPEPPRAGLSRGSANPILPGFYGGFFTQAWLRTLLVTADRLDLQPFIFLQKVGSKNPNLLIPTRSFQQWLAVPPISGYLSLLTCNQSQVNPLAYKRPLEDPKDFQGCMLRNRRKTKHLHISHFSWSCSSMKDHVALLFV